MKDKRAKKNSYSCFEGRERGFVNPVRVLKRWRRNILHAYQRIRYGYCDRDVWSIDWWFLHVAPNMLQDLRETTHGCPQQVCDMVGYDCNSHNKVKEQEAVEKWDSILAEIIFYLKEANEDTCQRKNPYEEEYLQCWKEFHEKYDGGDKLKTKEEKQNEKKSGSYRMYFPSELPEYKSICDNYLKYEQDLMKYRDECKDKGLLLFKEWFWSLWD